MSQRVGRGSGHGASKGGHLQGFLEKVGGNESKRSWRRRYFQLENQGTELCYYKEKKDAKPKGSIPLIGAKVLDRTDLKSQNKKQQARSFGIQTENRTFTLRAPSVPERRSWLTQLRALPVFQNPTPQCGPSLTHAEEKSASIAVQPSSLAPREGSPQLSGARARSASQRVTSSASQGSPQSPQKWMPRNNSSLAAMSGKKGAVSYGAQIPGSVGSPSKNSFLAENRRKTTSSATDPKVEANPKTEDVLTAGKKTEDSEGETAVSKKRVTNSLSEMDARASKLLEQMDLLFEEKSASKDQSHQTESGSSTENQEQVLEHGEKSPSPDGLSSEKKKAEKVDPSAKTSEKEAVETDTSLNTEKVAKEKAAQESESGAEEKEDSEEQEGKQMGMQSESQWIAREAKVEEGDQQGTQLGVTPEPPPEFLVDGRSPFEAPPSSSPQSGSKRTSHNSGKSSHSELSEDETIERGIELLNQVDLDSADLGNENVVNDDEYAAALLNQVDFKEEEKEVKEKKKIKDDHSEKDPEATTFHVNENLFKDDGMDDLPGEAFLDAIDNAMLTTKVSKEEKKKDEDKRVSDKEDEEEEEEEDDEDSDDEDDDEDEFLDENDVMLARATRLLGKVELELNGEPAVGVSGSAENPSEKVKTEEYDNYAAALLDSVDLSASALAAAKEVEDACNFALENKTSISSSPNTNELHQMMDEKEEESELEQKPKGKEGKTELKPKPKENEGKIELEQKPKEKEGKIELEQKKKEEDSEENGMHTSIDHVMIRPESVAIMHGNAKSKKDALVHQNSRAGRFASEASLDFSAFHLHESEDEEEEEEDFTEIEMPDREIVNKRIRGLSRGLAEKMLLFQQVVFKVESHFVKGGGGDDTQDPVIASLVRGEFTTALARLLSFGIRRTSGTPTSFVAKLFGSEAKPPPPVVKSVWEIICAFNRGRASVHDVDSLALSRAIASVNADHRHVGSPHMRLRAWVCIALNSRKLGEWMTCLSNSPQVRELYDESLAPNQGLFLFAPAVLLVRDLCMYLRVLRFKLSVHYEFLVPKQGRRKPSSHRQAVTEKTKAPKAATEGNVASKADDIPEPIEDPDPIPSILPSSS